MSEPLPEPAAEAAEASHPPIFGLVHLSGSRHGTTEMLFDEELAIGTDDDSDIHVPADREPAVAPHHARLERRGQTYRLLVSPGQVVTVNDVQVDDLVLASGDVIELGDGGPRLRFRVYKASPRPYKTMTEALADCVDCTREDDGALKKTRTFFRTAGHELKTRTSLRLRLGLLVLAVVVAASTATQTYQSFRLGRELEVERHRVQGLAELLERSEELTSEDIRGVRDELAEGLTGTLERVNALEERAGASRRVISGAARSVVFLQGAYGFLHGLNRRMLRFVTGPDGRVVIDEQGNPAVSPGATGEPVESFFTGTGFVATDDGLIVTNRHVALPWEFDETAQAVIAQGFEPQITRFVGYLEDVEVAFPVELVDASDAADLAVLRCTVTSRVPPLPLATTPIEVGEEVIVLGYPTGIRALLARTDENFVEELMARGGLDFWGIAKHLSEAGHIAPLATRGIVGQVTAAAVVYDADTTSGGSGGPVVNLRGEVVAINTAILPEFGGANQGVPVTAALALLGQGKEAPAVLIEREEIPVPTP